MNATNRRARARRGLAGRDGSAAGAAARGGTVRSECGIRAFAPCRDGPTILYYDFLPNMDVGRLIDCVREHEFLYDICHREYKNFGLKAATWEMFARELNESSKF